eukprot:g70874.t1
MGRNLMVTEIFDFSGKARSILGFRVCSPVKCYVVLGAVCTHVPGSACRSRRGPSRAHWTARGRAGGLALSLFLYPTLSWVVTMSVSWPAHPFPMTFPCPECNKRVPVQLNYNCRHCQGDYGIRPPPGLYLLDEDDDN